MQLDYLLSDDALGELAPALKPLFNSAEQILKNPRHGDFLGWKSLLDQLPDITPTTDLDQDSVLLGQTHPQQMLIQDLLMGLHPWRKGPFNLAGIEIDTEWHSDWKWNRLAAHIGPLDEQRILDIGCGNGYFGWRMLGAGAKLVVGIDPTLLFVMQYFACRKFAGSQLANIVLPFGIEDLPAELTGFDTVFSMGVFYHRRSPFEHLQRLRKLARPGGRVVLETLVVEGDKQTVLVPEDRYARMRNVWFLPSSACLGSWMHRVGFKDIVCVDETDTSIAEQRSTEWMRFESLSESLNEDQSKTVEGYPAPRRAILIATT